MISISVKDIELRSWERKWKESRHVLTTHSWRRQFWDLYQYYYSRMYDRAGEHSEGRRQNTVCVAALAELASTTWSSQPSSADRRQHAVAFIWHLSGTSVSPLMVNYLGYKESPCVQASVATLNSTIGALPTGALHALVHAAAFVASRIDYCNAVLY